MSKPQALGNGGMMMGLPDLVRQVGTIDEKERVYVEDYVYTYLNQLKREGEIFPHRAALFGHASRKDGVSVYLIYGAASVVDELKCGRTEEEIRKKYFEDYQLIGYVNIYGGRQKLPDKKKGYYVFYEKNEPMQNYLLSCFERRNREQAERQQEGSKGRKASALWNSRETPFSIGSAIRRFFYGGCIVVLAIAVTAINDYSKMHGFVDAVERAAMLTETDDI